MLQPRRDLLEEAFCSADSPWKGQNGWHGTRVPGAEQPSKQLEGRRTDKTHSVTRLNGVAKHRRDPRSAFVKLRVCPPALTKVTVDDPETAIRIRRGLEASRNRLPKHQPVHASTPSAHGSTA